MEHLAELFERLRKAKLVINLAKTEFAKAEVTFLGCRIRTDGAEKCEDEGHRVISKTIIEEGRATIFVIERILQKICTKL